jgi:predicted nucleic acid-binding protein
VRILCNPAFSANALTPANALRVLETNLNLPSHHFWPDSLAVVDALKKIEQRFTGHRQITDAYLLSLAVHHRGKLATLDQRIRGWGPETAVEVIE